MGGNHETFLREEIMSSEPELDWEFCFVLMPFWAFDFLPVVDNSLNGLFLDFFETMTIKDPIFTTSSSILILLKDSWIHLCFSPWLPLRSQMLSPPYWTNVMMSTWSFHFDLAFFPQDVYTADPGPPLHAVFSNSWPPSHSLKPILLFGYFHP